MSIDFVPDKGQWVCFHAALPIRLLIDADQVHTTEDGFLVGIWDAGAPGKALLNGAPQAARPARIMLVDRSGQNVPHFEGGAVQNAGFALDAVTDLQAADTRDLPPGYVGNPIDRPERLRTSKAP